MPRKPVTEQASYQFYGRGRNFTRTYWRREIRFALTGLSKRYATPRFGAVRNPNMKPLIHNGKAKR